MQTFDIVLADPPWKFPKRKPGTKFGGGAGGNYPMMKDADIMGMAPYVQTLTSPNAALLLWVTGSKLVLGMDTMKAWGFDYSTIYQVWLKTNAKEGTIFRGPGNASSQNVELLLLGYKRGGKALEIKENLVEQVIRAPHPRFAPDHPDPKKRGKIIHSAKPPEQYNRIERTWGTDVRRLELFARQLAPGWDAALGNEIDGLDIREAMTRLIKGGKE